MKTSRDKLIIFILLFLLSLINFLTIYIISNNQDKLRNELNNSIISEIGGIRLPRDGKDGVDGRDGKDGYTPIKGKDYNDGTNGNDGLGIKGDKGDTGETGAAGKDGLTPQIRCNTKKNQWEVRYSDTDNWSLLNNERVKCTPEGGL